MLCATGRDQHHITKTRVIFLKFPSIFGGTTRFVQRGSAKVSEPKCKESSIIGSRVKKMECHRNVTFGFQCLTQITLSWKAVQRIVWHYSSYRMIQRTDTKFLHSLLMRSSSHHFSYFQYRSRKGDPLEISGQNAKAQTGTFHWERATTSHLILPTMR